MSPEDLLLRVIIAGGLGLFSLISGIQMVKDPMSHKPITYILAITLVKILGNDIQVKRKEDELIQPTKIKRHGKYRIIGGIIGLTACIGFIIIYLLYF